MIQKTVSNILGYSVPEGAWEETFAKLEKEGRLTAKHVHKILAVLLKKEEERESTDL